MEAQKEILAGAFIGIVVMLVIAVVVSAGLRAIRVLDGEKVYTPSDWQR